MEKSIKSLSDLLDELELSECKNEYIKGTLKSIEDMFYSIIENHLNGDTLMLRIAVETNREHMEVLFSLAGHLLKESGETTRKVIKEIYELNSDEKV